MKTKALEPRRNLADNLADALRGLILAAEWTPNAYLPAERELCERYKVSRVTVRRSLARLVDEGLLEAIPYKGYRLRPPTQLPVSRTIAYVLAQAEPGARWDRTHAHILSAFQRVQVEQNGSVLAVGTLGRPTAEVFRELKDAHVAGAVLDTSRDDYVATALDSGLPCVIVDAFHDAAALDTVIQDNFGGTRIAAEHLMARGHARIGWVGPTRAFAHWRERFAGARAALHDRRRDFAPEDIAEPADNEAQDEAEALVARMLSRADRPTALVCPWIAMTLGAARAVRKAGLALGRDVEVVGWSNEIEYREVLAPEFLGGEMPAVMAWRPDEMALLAVGRLHTRAAAPQTPCCRISVKVRLIEPRNAERVLRGV
ncbi:MAG: GntR family transcriptional regulator [Planctomycetota bacterium]|nr:GntR family transcriptional regulator [Planctomycetota bacterium]